jgi:hypothetical protein
MRFELRTANECAITQLCDDEMPPIQIQRVDPNAMNQGTDLSLIGFNSRTQIKIIHG